MIIPEKSSKSYGVVNTQEYFSFIGFSKHVDNKDFQEVDIYIDNELITTIKADKCIENIDEIYDINGYSFQYNLEQKYMHNYQYIHFKNHTTSEELKNSPIEILNTSNPLVSYFRLLHNVKQPINENALKTVYSEKSLGFFALAENLKEQNFIHFIKEIHSKVPELIFKPICFNEEQEKLIKKRIPIKEENLQIITPENIYSLTQEIEFFIYFLNNDLDIQTSNIIRDHSLEISGIYFDQKNIHMTLRDYEKTIKNPFIENPSFFNLDTQVEKKFSDSFYEIFFYLIDPNFNVNLDITVAQLEEKVIINSLSNHEFKINYKNILLKLNTFYKKEAKKKDKNGN
jgi:hypothetical protein